MRLIKYFHLAICVMLVTLLSCKEDDPEPAYELKARLLAGAKGASKNWSLTSATVTFEGDTEPFEFDPCFLDNVYKFTNNATQDYELTEGLTKCATDAPTIVESGNWSFTSDGEILIVLTYNFTGSDAVIFAFLARPAIVKELTEDSLKLEIELDLDGEIEIYNLNFEAN
ncbi:MAG: lipocalin family protein [Cytophagales bacterium]|jgi:hypothetical protein|nr:lipocalin family protein [Cytophagales bacterium]